MKIPALILGLFLFLTAGCKAFLGITVAKKDGEIPTDISGVVTEKSKVVIEAFKARELARLLPLFPDELVDDPLKAAIQKMQQALPEDIGIFKAEAYHDYFVTDYSFGEMDSPIFSETTPRFSIQYKRPKRKSYVSIWIMDAIVDHFPETFLIPIIWSLWDGEWRLFMTSFSGFKLSGKEPLEWITKAENENSPLAALLIIQGIAPLIHPFTGFQWVGADKKMAQLSNSLIPEVQKTYNFPITITEIEGSPRVFEIVPQLLNAGIVPQIRYATSVPLANHAALEAEANKLDNVLDKYFRNVRGLSSEVIYTAFDKIPSAGDKNPTYGTIIYH